MELEVMKYQFIEEIIRLNNKELLLKLTNLLKKENKQIKPQSEMDSFFGIWNTAEAYEIELIINHEFSKIDYESWQ